MLVTLVVVFMGMIVRMSMVMIFVMMLVTAFLLHGGEGTQRKVAAGARAASGIGIYEVVLHAVFSLLKSR